MGTGRPYVRNAEFREWLYGQPPERLTRSLSIRAVLNQSKAYLYWCRDWLDRRDIAT
jgi:hypothetical protein